jgi:hypothetical protein
MCAVPALLCLADHLFAFACPPRPWLLAASAGGPVWIWELFGSGFGRWLLGFLLGAR